MAQRLVAEGPPKLCPRCGFKRPRSEFYGVRASNGCVYAMGLCIEHTKARVIASQVADPERVKRNRKRSRENRKRDPERLAIHRTFQREWARKKRGITPDRYRVAVPVADIGQCPNVPAAPFVAWLRTLGTTRLEIAHACGLSSESVNQYLIGRHQYVRLDTVDRACLYAGADLNDLYPLEDAA